MESQKEEILKQKDKIKDLKQKIKKETTKLKGMQKKRLFSFKKIKSEDTSYKFKEVMIIMLFSLGLGFATCFSIITIFNGGRNYFTLSKDLDKFLDAYYAIVDNYYGDLDKEKLVNSAIEGMINSVGDAYTNYTDSETATSFLETVEGKYEGIGCTIAQNKDGKIIVVDLIENGPSLKAGLKINDVILKVDNLDAKENSTTELSNYIKNNKNSSIELTILREDKELKIKVERKEIEIPTVSEKIFERNNKKIGYIGISIFSSVTDKQFKTALKNLQNDKIDGLIIDVRNNGGGYLSSVTNIANLILEKDKIIYKLQDKKIIKEVKDTTKESLKIPVAVLTNNGSASASEILASAIKESYGGYVVGTNTYGKGTVQQTANLKDGSMIKYTIQNWLTPNGTWINEKGLEPTNIVELNEKYFQDATYENDNQLQTAIELLIK